MKILYYVVTFFALNISLFGAENPQDSKNNVSHFNLGEERYCDIKMHKDITRAQWYDAQMKEQENRLKRIVESSLGMTAQDVHCFQQKAFEVIAAEEAIIIEGQIDPFGTWVKDDMSRSFRRVDQDYQPQRDSEFVFNITHSDIESCKELGRKAGYTGNVVFMNYDGSGGMMAKHSLILVQIDVLFWLTELPESIFINYLHEMSHLKNQDLLWDYTIKHYILNLPKNYRGGIDFNNNELKKKGITVGRHDEAFKAFQEWFVFHERRADMQAYIEALKFPEILKIATCPHNQQSYLQIQYPNTFVYQINSPVQYCTDFIQGSMADEKN